MSNEFWSDLPVDVRSTDITREQFKRGLKSWLFECAYDSLRNSPV